MAITFIILLIITEFYHYAIGSEAYHDHLSVDVGITHKIPVNFNITFHSMQCQGAHVCHKLSRAHFGRPYAPTPNALASHTPEQGSFNLSLCSQF